MTLELIERVLLQLSGPLAIDSSGEPVLSDKMVTIWEEEKKHVKCIQDPDGIILYTITGHITKGGVELPVFRCARGTTSLESFHLHLAGYADVGINVLTCIIIFVRFIPGSSASDVHYQGFLLEGLSRWNQARALAAAQHHDCQLRSFNLQLASKVALTLLLLHESLELRQVNHFSESFFGTRLFPYHHIPTQHDEGEFFGVKYL